MKKNVFIFLLIFISLSLYSKSRELWDLHFQVNVTAVTGIPNISGAETDGEYFYICSSLVNQVAKLDLTGNLIEAFHISNLPFALRDLTTDGTYFYSGSGSASTIVQLDFDTHTIVGDITTPMAVDGLAYDPGEDAFWITNWQSQMLMLIDRNGTVLNQMVFTDGANGLTHQTDPEGNDYLWIYSGIYTGGDGIVTQYSLPGLVPTGLTHNVTTDFPETHSGGLLFSNEIIPGIEILGGIAKGTTCYLFGYEIGTCGAAPGPPTDFILTADPGGAYEVLISWTNPEVDINGNPLTNLDEIRLYRDGVLIYTEPWPEIGEECTYNDIGISGEIQYMACSYNCFGGSSVSGEVWVGPDVPAAVTNFFGQQIGNTLEIELTWENPMTGLHGGPFLDPVIGYILGDNMGSFIDIPYFTTLYSIIVPGTGIYCYTITPYNIIGDGGTATSNDIVVEITYADFVLNPEIELSNFPNPFNPSTTIEFNLPQSFETAKIEIFNIKGQRVKTFSNLQITQSSNHQITWNGTDENHKSVSSGIYFYQLKVDDKIVKTRKMMLIK